MKKASRLDVTDAPKRPKCGKKMVPRSGRFGDFYGWNRYTKIAPTEETIKHQNQDLKSLASLGGFCFW